MKRFLAVLIAFSLIINLPITTHATSNDTQMDMVLSLDDTEIFYFELDDGTRVFLQYVNGILTQKNTFHPSYPNTIHREIYSSEKGTIRDTIQASDYITVSTGPVTHQPQSRATQGTIRYRAVLDTGPIYYGLRCSYTSTDSNTTYTINNYVGALVDLVAVLVSATNLLASIGTTVLRRICISAGITIAGGIIKSALSTTVSSVKTAYTWTLVDTTDSGHYKNVYGEKYYVTDSNYHTGDTYYEGYVPADWGTQALAVWFHNEMFAYSAWGVEGWD